ncbi:MAG TPA: trigger factor [Candidatus Kapabacteria bacterium]
MTSTIHEHSQIQRELDITVEEAELQSAFDDAYKTMRSRLALPGFRPGKAPLAIVKRMHGDAIEGDALERLAQEKFREAAEELKIEPLGAPVMTDLHRHPGSGAHFKIMYEIRPEITIQDYSGLEIPQKKLVVTEEDVTERVNRLRFGLSEREPATKVEDEQTIVKMQMNELLDEDAIDAGKEPGKSEQTEIYLADPEIVAELKQALIGQNVGAKVVVELPHQKREPGTDMMKEGRGRVEVEILEAQKVLLPPLDEQLIKKISEDKFSTEEELRAEIKRGLEESATKRMDERLEEDIVQKLMEMHPFEVPRTISNAILGQMLEEREQENVRRGFPANYGLDDAQFREQYQPIADARAKWMLLRDKLLESENIEATDEDYEKLAEEESTKYGVAKENLLKYYHKHDSIANRIVSDKLGARLREKVKITEA